MLTAKVVSCTYMHTTACTSLQLIHLEKLYVLHYNIKSAAAGAQELVLFLMGESIYFIAMYKT